VEQESIKSFMFILDDDTQIQMQQKYKKYSQDSKASSALCFSVCLVSGAGVQVQLLLLYEESTAAGLMNNYTTK
jgi:hypothetical protein